MYSLSFIHLITFLVCTTYIKLTYGCDKGDIKDPFHVNHTSDINASSIVKTAYESVYRIPLISQQSEDIGWYVMLDLRAFGFPVPSHDCLEVVYITTSNDLTHTDLLDNTVNVYNSGRRYGYVILDIYSYWNQPLEGISIMYDISGKEVIESFFLSFDGVFLLATYTTETEDDIISALQYTVSSSDTRNFVIVASPEVILKILKQAISLDLLLPSYNWFVISTGCELRYSPEIHQSNILILQDHQQKLVFDKIQLILDRTPTDAFKNQTKLSDNSTCCEDTTCLQQRKRLRDKVKNITKQALESPYNVITLKRYNKKNGLSSEVGNWTAHSGLQIVSTDFKDNTLIPKLRVVTLPENPFVIKTNTNSEIVYTGLIFEVLKLVSEDLGFTYSVRECSDGGYGTYDEVSRTWSGCIADVKNGYADLIAVPLTASSDRQSVVDFPVPYFGYSGIQMLKKKNTKPTFFFGDVLSLPIWFCIIGIVIVTSMLMTIYERCIPSSKPVQQVKTIHSIKEAFWFSISTIAFAGSCKRPKGISSRILIAGYWFACTIIMSAFTANMAAFLTVSRLDDSFGSLEKLAKNSAINYTVIAGSATLSYFENMASIEKIFEGVWERLNTEKDMKFRTMPIWDYPLDEKYSLIWDRMSNTGFINSSSVAVEKVIKDNIVILTDSSFVKNFVERNCKLEAPAKAFSSRPYGFAIRKRSSFKRKFSESLLNLQEKKILDTLKSKWWNKDLRYCNTHTLDQGLSLYEMIYSFIVAVTAAGSGLFVLACEILVEKITKTSKKYGVNVNIRSH